jgi:hypothetical protein
MLQGLRRGRNATLKAFDQVSKAMNDDSRHPLRTGREPGPKEAAAWNQFALGRVHGSLAEVHAARDAEERVKSET